MTPQISYISQPQLHEPQHYQFEKVPRDEPSPGPSSRASSRQTQRQQFDSLPRDEPIAGPSRTSSRQQQLQQELQQHLRPKYTDYTRQQQYQPAAARNGRAMATEL